MACESAPPAPPDPDGDLAPAALAAGFVADEVTLCSDCAKAQVETMQIDKAIMAFDMQAPRLGRWQTCSFAIRCLSQKTNAGAFQALSETTKVVRFTSAPIDDRGRHDTSCFEVKQRGVNAAFDRRMVGYRGGGTGAPSADCGCISRVITNGSLNAALRRRLCRAA